MTKPSCRVGSVAAEQGATDVLYTSLVVVFVLVPLLVWVAFFADFEDSAKEKVA